MKAGLNALVALVVTVMFSQASASTRQLQGRSLAAASAWTFEEHDDATINNYVGSCYRAAYSYYTNFKCVTLDGNCVGGANYCATIDDPRDDDTSKVGYYLSIILPSVFGGLCLIFCCCVACGAYFGVQGYNQY